MGATVSASWVIAANAAVERPSPRFLQSDSIRGNVYKPECPWGYIDVTYGKAFWWSCAKGCPGGAYADEDCRCACQVPGTLVTSLTSTITMSTSTATTSVTRTETITSTVSQV